MTTRTAVLYARVSISEQAEQGYPQIYGGRTYTVLGVQMNNGVWFLWPMKDDPSDSEVLNLKPCSMRPEKEGKA